MGGAYDIHAMVCGSVGPTNVLCFQKIIGTYYQMSISCFLIDTKCISKILWILIMQSLSFFDPHLHKI